MREDRLVENPWSKWEDKADPHVPTGTLQIYNDIGRLLKKEDAPNVLRASMATMCPKRRQYTANGEEGTPLTPRKLINFMLGHLTEKTLQFFIKKGCVGDGKLYKEVRFGDVIGSFKYQDEDIELYDQPEWGFDIKAAEKLLHISAHPDGVGLRNADNKWELIEIKSAANWGFKQFKEEGAGDYLKQAHACMMCDEAKELGVDSVRFWYMRKETGHVWDIVHDYDNALGLEVVSNYIDSVSSVAIASPHGLVSEMTGRGSAKRPTGKKIAKFPCTYCPYLEKCHGKFKLEWKGDQWGNQKPMYVF